MTAFGRFLPVARRSKIPKKRTFAYFTLRFFAPLRTPQGSIEKNLCVESFDCF